MTDLYVTTLRPDRSHPWARRELRDVCRMHSRIIDATVGMPEGGPRKLWAQPRPDMLVVRATEPITGSRLPEGWAREVSHREWSPPAEPGRYRMVTVVNPGRHGHEGGPTLNQPDRPRVNAAPVLYDDPADQQTWLARRLPGVHIDRYRVVRKWVAQGQHRGGRRICVRCVAVACEVTVTDPDAIRDRLLAGVGMDKTWGCGLTLWEPLS